MDSEGTRNSTDAKVDLGHLSPEVAAAAASAAPHGRIVLTPNAENVVMLPAGATLDDISVQGRDLVVKLDNGQVYVIPDGAIYVPEIVIDGVAVPPLNLAALLVGNEPAPAAGSTGSSGGNFAGPVDPIQDAYKIGNLLPYTELHFPEPQAREIFPPVINQEPEAGDVFANLDDDALEGGNPGGIGDDDPDSVNIVGNLIGSGGDGALTFGFLVSGAPDGFTYALNGTTLEVFQGATKVMEITLDPATGAYEIDQLAPVMHAPGGDENNQIFVISYTVTDEDGDIATGTLNISVDDDTPVALVNGQAPVDTFVLDESPAGTDSVGGVAPTGLASFTANFADNFVTAVSYGADGPGTTAYALALSANGAGSGLYALDASDTTASDGDGIGKGAQILLSQSGNTITGSVGGTDYFTITIDPVTGDVTFTQLANIWHATAGDHDDSSILTAAAGTILVQQVVTDADHDTVRASIDLSAGVFTIQDDGPTAAVDQEARVDVLVLDESAVGTDTAGGTLPVGISSTTADFSDNFLSGSYGTDGAGTTTYSLTLTGTNVGSGLYALDQSDMSPVGVDGDGIGQGAEIVLNLSGNTITGSANGINYFTISIDPASGVVTFTQIHNIWHGDTANPDDPETLTLDSADLMQVVQTVMDRDGDTATAAVGIGQGVFTIQDDGPTAGVDPNAVLDTLVLDESAVGTDSAGGTLPVGLASITANFADNFVAPVHIGTDGTGSVVYSLTLADNDLPSGLYALDAADTSVVDGDGYGQGAEIVLNQSGNVITGSAGGTDYFTITIDPATGVVTFQQLANIWHDNTANPDDPETLTLDSADLMQVVQTVTDRDGDTTSAELNIGQGVFTIQDDGPVAGTPTGPVDTLVLDESAVGTDSTGGTLPVGLASITANFADNFVGGSFGTDGAGTTAYSLALTGSNVGSGLYALDATDTSVVDGDGYGQGAEIVLNQSGNVITGSAGGTDYFTITIDPATGVVTFQQIANIWHDDTTNHDDPETLTLDSADLLQVVQTITDRDGDTATAAINIGTGVFTVQDDGPTAAVDGEATLDTLVLDETRPAGTDTSGGVLPTGRASITADFSDNFITPVNYGTDGAGTTIYSLALTGTNVASGLYALDGSDKSAVDGDGYGQGAEIVLNQSGNVITGSANGTAYFTITIDPATGIVTFAQLANIWHPTSGSSYDEAVTLTTATADLIQVVQAVTDSDGDTASASVNVGQNVFTIQDDGPIAGTITSPPGTIVLDESAVGTDTAGGTLPVGLASITVDLSAIFGSGALGTDLPGTGNFALVLTGTNVASGLYALDASDTTTGDGDGIGQGAQIVLNQSGNIVTGSVNGTEYFTISIDPGTGEVTFTQLENIWHPTPGSSYDEAATLTLAQSNLLQVQQQVTDADGDTATASVNLGQGVFIIQDDGPVAGTPTGPADTLVLDESPVGTDTAGGTLPVGLTSITANFADNFVGGGYGTDGSGTTAYSLALTGSNVASGLYALDASDTTTGDGDGIGQGSQILLNQVGNVITGSANGTNYFTITIDPTTGVVTFAQSANIWHPTSGSSYDEPATLTLANANLMQVVQTITDGDGDVASAAVNVGTGVFTIQDAGPTAGTTTGSADTLVLDETRPVGTDTTGGTLPVGLASITANFADNFTGGSVGTDGAGSTGYSLALTGGNVLSGLYALDVLDTTTGDGDGIGQGSQIVLNQVGNVVTGSANGINYFTITIDPATGVVTFAQINNIWHPTPGTSYDEGATLTLANANLLQVVRTITDRDGDTASVGVNVGTGVFTIQDSGPTAAVNGAVTLDTLTLDESRPVGTDTLGGTAPNGLASTTANFSDNFVSNAATYGTDGAGSTSYGLLLSSPGLASGLYALDATDTSAGDGDGIGQGDPILLTQAGNVITGSANGTDYFTIAINPATGVVTFTQINNIWHPIPGASSFDEPATLNMQNANLMQVVQTVTDGDGDTASIGLNVGQGVFIIQDDGPSLTGALLNEVTSNSPDATPLIGDLFFDAGSDGPSVTNISFLTSGITSGGHNLVFDQSGNVFTAYADVDGSGTFTPGDTAVFTLTIDPTGGSTGQHTFDLLAPLDGALTTVAVDGSTSFGAGPKPFQILSVTNWVTDPVAIVSGWTTDGSFNAANWFNGTNVLPAGVVYGQVNGSTSGWGVANNEFNPTEFMRFDFGQPIDDFDGGGAYNPPLATDLPEVSTATFELSGFSGANVVQFVVHNTDGTTSNLQVTGAALGNPIVLTAAPGQTIDWVDAYVVSGAGKIDLVSVEIPSLEVDQQLDFNIVLSDADGDTVSGNLTINIDSPNPGTTTRPDPMTLDESRPIGTDTGALAVAPAGLALITQDFTDHFSAYSNGAGGPGTVEFSLSIIGNNTSGLYALDTNDTDAGDGDGYGQGDQILLVQNGNVITGEVGGETYFTITFDLSDPANLNVTFEQLLPIWNSDPTNTDEAEILTMDGGAILVTRTITDGDGITSSTSIDFGKDTFIIQDAAPTPILDITGLHITHDESPGLQVSDSDGPFAAVFAAITNVGADPSNPLPGAIGFSRNIGALASPGTTTSLDGQHVQFSLDIASDGVDSGLNITSGESVVLHKETYGGVDFIVGRVVGGTFDGKAAFAFHVNPTNGEIDLVQFLSLEHPLGVSNYNDVVSINNNALLAVVTVTDGDGDTGTVETPVGNLFSFIDDAPTAVSPDYGVIKNSAGSPVLFDLDIDDNAGNNFGNDGPGEVRFAASLDGTNSGMTSGGLVIWYSLSPDGQTLTGETHTSGGDPLNTVFVVTLQPGANDNSYSVQMVGQVDSFTDVSFNDGTYDFIGGNTAWVGFVPVGQKESGTPLNDNSPDLLMTPIGASGARINGNANSVGVTGGGAGQNIGTGEGVRLDFVQDLTGTPGANDYTTAANRTHDFDAHYLVNGVALKFGDGTSNATVSFKAILVTPQVIDNNGDDNVADPVAGTGSLVSVTSIAIAYDGEKEIVVFDPLDADNTQTVTVGNPGGLVDRSYTVHFVNSGGQWYAEVTGIYDANVQISTFSGQQYNALEVLYLGPGDSSSDFAITGFGIGVQTTLPVLETLPIEVVDGDGDVAGSYLNLTFVSGDVADHSNDLVGDSHVYTATAANPNVVGSDFADTITGDGDGNTLFGGAGNDTINGGAGQDTLIGGAGSDTLTGGVGNDTFVLDQTSLKEGAALADHITDFTRVAGNMDVIDLTQIITIPGGGSVGNYVRYNSTTGVLQVDTDGSGAGSTWVTVGIIDNHPATVVVKVTGLSAQQTIASSSFPIVMDLDGDGAEFLGRDAGVSYDYFHNGNAVSTAWAGSDDGVLAHVTATGLDIVFADDAAGATTDLEGVRLAYDSNLDGVFDAHDTEYAKFGVWQDANSNGVVDEGEYHTLAELGITSINLTADNHGYAAANDEVTVYGTGSYTLADGTTRSLADVAFATGPLKQMDARANEIATTTALAGAFLATAAAAADVPPASSNPTEESHTSDPGTSSAAPEQPQTAEVSQPQPQHQDLLTTSSQDHVDAPQSTTHDHDDSTTTSDAHGADDNPALDQPGSTGNDTAHYATAMDVLLVAAAAAEAKAGGEAVQPSVTEALADVKAGEMVDTLVDFFASHSGDHPALGTDGHVAGLLNVLAGHVSGDAPFVLNPIDLNQLVDDAHVQAAANA